jgi:ribonucleoside-diphosphate reductase alpha chain
MISSNANGQSSKERTGNEAVLQPMSLQQEILFLQEVVQYTVADYKEEVDQSLILDSVLSIVKKGMDGNELLQSLIFSTTSFIEVDPAYSRLCSNMLQYLLFTKVTGSRPSHEVKTDMVYRQAFVRGIREGVEHGLLDKRLLDFDLEYLAAALYPERDTLFDYMGLKQLYDRYFLRRENHYFELPQAFWMRVAMGTALLEKNKNEVAISFYTMMSQFRYVPSTPTLLHAGKAHPQLSSCYLTTIADDLHDIFKAYADNAQMAKWSGGVANDWSYIRACGSMVKSISTESQGLIPFLKIVDVTTASINRSGKRRGACCVYLEVWHLEVEDFLDLKKNTGDERRRTHDINTAIWVPDLFMKRMQEKGTWMLFSPHEVPDLHDLYGAAFEQKYQKYEAMALSGEITMFKVISAEELWKKILIRLFETGHPWICFKDPSNIRSPQDHAGVIHSSNLCTEILLNTSFTETAVCNIGSINFAKHIHNKKIDNVMIAETISTAMHMLDNIIDINYYPTKEGKHSNLRHRPVGLGVMGFQDMLYMLDIPFSSEKARDFADEMGEFVAYHAILSSSRLAKERGTYQTYRGSKWDRGILPQDTIDLLEKERGQEILVSRKSKMDWNPVREHIKQYGMRNSTTMAIAPTATIANIAGVFPSIEPIYKNLYVKANMSGEFTVINNYLVQELKKLGLWNQEMRDRLKYYDGSIQMITEIPESIREKYKEAFEINPLFLVEITAARGKWIDQSQSYNIFMKGVSGKLLHEIYLKAWRFGLKTTYYLRTLGASQIEKSTLDAKTFGFTQKRSYEVGQETKIVQNGEASVCNIDDPLSCESCQ